VGRRRAEWATKRVFEVWTWRIGKVFESVHITAVEESVSDLRERLQYQTQLQYRGILRPIPTLVDWAK